MDNLACFTYPLLTFLFWYIFRIAQEHAVINNKDGKVYLEPKQGIVLFNGEELKQESKLHHNDR